MDSAVVVVEEVLQWRRKPWRWGVQWLTITNWPTESIIRADPFYSYPRSCWRTLCQPFIQCLKLTGKLKKLNKWVPQVQFSSATQSCPTLCDPMNRRTPGLPVPHQLLESIKPMSIELMMPSSHLILCRPLLLLPTILPSIRVFSNESTLLMRWPKYWSFSFSISPSSEHPGLISFRMDWLDLLAVQGTLRSLLQQFFGTQLSSQSNSHIHTWPLEKP